MECRVEFRELKFPEDDKILLLLNKSRRDLLRVLTASDDYEYANSAGAATAPVHLLHRAAPCLLVQYRKEVSRTSNTKN
jgi:hypothetical protein